MTNRFPALTRRDLIRAASISAAGLAIPAAVSAAPGSRRSILSRNQGVTGTITVSYPDEAGFKPPFVDKAAQAVRDANPGATVNVDLQKVGDDDYYTKLLLALDSGDAPDVFHFGGDKIGELSDAGYILPLDDYVGKWEDWQYYPDSVRSGVTYQGHVDAIPYGLDTRFLYYRKDRLTEAGLAADWQPANVDGIIEAAKAVQTAGKAIPYALYAGQAGSSGTSDHAFVPLVWAFGGDVMDADGKWIGNSAAIVKALTYYKTAYVDDKLVPTNILTDTKPWTAMREKLGNGELALLFEGGWVYGGWVSNDAAGTQQNVGYLLHPTETGGPSFTIGGPGTCWYISAKSKSPDLAWEFIKSFNNKDTVAQLNIQDPHPVARTDSAQVPEFVANKFLVDATDSLKSARFVPPDPNYGKYITAVQTATGNVATGDASPEDAAKRFAEDLARTIGDDKVVTQ